MHVYPPGICKLPRMELVHKWYNLGPRALEFYHHWLHNDQRGGTLNLVHMAEDSRTALEAAIMCKYAELIMARAAYPPLHYSPLEEE